MLPRIVMVLGKGGVGRSTVAAALGDALAARGERVLVLEWSVAEAIAPWFGAPPAGTAPALVAPGLWVASYSLDEALRAYFVDHLRLRRFHKYIVAGPQVARLIDAAPGIAELLFLGQLWWLTTLAPKEAGLSFDRIIVDTPATGHGLSILALPATFSALGATGLLATEIERVRSMMGDPAWTGALVVALPEELAVTETLELVPHVTRDLGRPPIAALVNRSVTSLLGSAGISRAIGDLEARLSPAARAGLDTVLLDLRERVRRETELRRALAGATERGVFALDEQLTLLERASPRDVVRALAAPLGAHFAGGAA